jgi:hypothetical protein
MANYATDMSTVLTVVRTCISAVRFHTIAFALVAFSFSSAQEAAADQSAIAQLNSQVAVTLRSVVAGPHRPSFARPFAFDANHFPVPAAAGPLGSRFTLPAWAAPFARANRLLSVHRGGLDFDGWGALLPRGVVRLKYTMRV